MRKLILTFIFFIVSICTNAQQLLEVLKPHTSDLTPINLPPNITLGGGTTFIPSIYDDDYLPYTMPTTLANWSSYDAGGEKEKLIDYQGIISEVGKKIYIPATVVGEDSTIIPAYTSAPVMILADKTQDGHSKQILITWNTQTINKETTYIVATLKTVSGTLNIKKLDINRGIGSDGQGVLLAEIPYPSSSLNTTATFHVRAIAGIPDRKFGDVDQLHDFLYIPIVATRNKVWLNNNLGAEYSNVHSPYFNPSQQAKHGEDYKAYGSLFQWQRPADGHELINWTGDVSGTPVNGEETVLASNWVPNHNRFIKNDNSDTDRSWVEDTVNQNVNDFNLWQTNGPNNPCPDGFHVPKRLEWQPYYGLAAMNTPLKLSFARVRSFRNGIINEGYTTDRGFYWTSESYTDNKRSLQTWFNPNQVLQYSPPSHRGNGQAIRCIQD